MILRGPLYSLIVICLIVLMLMAYFLLLPIEHLQTLLIRMFRGIFVANVSFAGMIIELNCSLYGTVLAHDIALVTLSFLILIMHETQTYLWLGNSESNEQAMEIDRFLCTSGEHCK